MTPGRFRSLLLRWYDAHKRALPWRETRDPYEVMVAEIMLQQTQVARVLVRWQEWLRRFPTAVAVARAPLRDVLVAWQGMGYNNRAVRLRQCCEHVAAHGWPHDAEQLARLPGIGRYTAHAITCFAFGRRVPVVDVNVELVYAAFVPRTAAAGDYWTLAAKMLPRRRWYDYNQALFDLGTVIRSGASSSLPRALRKLYAGRRAGGERRPEKLYGGFPMRLYRGALVQFLREKEGHAATAGECAARISAKLASRPAPFALQVARRLEKDGIVTVRRDTVRLA
ncbi:MAG: A/G-specific adenine glycosylase [Planctomycetota bacterium]|nr:A/G-specific adenine glycosylase [Planctomycetota bacterium]